MRASVDTVPEGIADAGKEALGDIRQEAMQRGEHLHGVSRWSLKHELKGSAGALAEHEGRAAAIDEDRPGEGAADELDAVGNDPLGAKEFVAKLSGHRFAVCVTLPLGVNAAGGAA